MSRNSKIWLAILLIITVFLLAGSLAGDVIASLFPGLGESLAQFVGYILIFVLAIGFAQAVKKPLQLYIPLFKPEPERLNPRLILSGVILTFAASIILNPIIDAMPQQDMETLTDYMQGGLWPMITSVIAAPILEEFLFRGIIQRNLIRMLGPITGIITGAVIFGLIHFIPQQIIYASGAGIIIGTIYYVTGSLNTVIAIHFVNNGLAYLLFMAFGTSSYIESEILDGSTSFIIAYCVSAVLLLVSAWYAYRRITTNKKRALKKREN